MGVKKLEEKARQGLTSSLTVRDIRQKNHGFNNITETVNLAVSRPLISHSPGTISHVAIC